MLDRTAKIVFWTAVVALSLALLALPWGSSRSGGKSGQTGADASSADEGIDALAEISMILVDSAFASPPVQTPSGAEQRAKAADSNSAKVNDSATTRQSAPALQSRNQQELTQRWLEVANDIDPALGARLTALSHKSPAAFDRAMRHGNVGRNLNSMAVLKQRDPDLYQTKVSLMMQTVQVNRIAAQLRDAIRTNSAGQIDTLKAKLKTALEHQLGIEIKDKGDYICRIEEQLDRAREDLIREAVNFPHTIEARMGAHMKSRAGESAEADDLASPDAADDLVDEREAEITSVKP